MRHFLLMICAFLLYNGAAKAQCGAGTFSADDTICPMRPVTIDNSVDTAVRYNWDFGPGDLDSLAQPDIVWGFTSAAQTMKLVKENGRYYGFVLNAFTGYIVRFDFGTSLNGNPTVVALNANALLAGFASAIEMVKEGNKWIGFIGAFSSNHLIRMELDSITQTDPLFTDLGTANLQGPVQFKLIEHYLFVTNQGSDITRFDFGNSFMNTPTALPAIASGFAYNGGIDIAFDCPSQKYIGFMSAYSANQMLKMDFGNSLQNTPAISTVYSLPSPQGVSLVNEAGKWHLFAVTGSNRLYHFTLGNSIDNTPTYNYDDYLSGYLNDPKNIQFAHDSSNWYALIPNGSANVKLLRFNQAANHTTTGGSDEASPTNLIYQPGTTGYQTYECTAYYSDGSTRIYTDSVYVDIPPPVSAFSASPGCLNSAIQFNNHSDICYGTITGVRWDFGDGNSDTTYTPQHTYQGTGSFTVELTVFGSAGDSSKSQQTITIYQLPVADFSLTDSICAGSKVSFTDQSTSADGTLQNWLWDFGDSNNDTLASPQHSYTNNGLYQITLTVTASTGCTSTATKSVHIKSLPIAAFSMSNTCIGETVQFTDQSVMSGGNIAAYTWNFGDLSSSNQQHPTHNYPAAANGYTVRLITQADNGCTDTIVNNIRIGAQPLPWFTMTMDTACVGNEIVFTDSSFAAIGESISARYWDLGDNTYDSTQVSVHHSYQLPGLYTIRLTIVSPTSCDSTISRQVFVIESPAANFSSTNVCNGDGTPFTDLSSSPAGSSIVSWNWHFGDGDSSLAANPSHTFAQPGIYTASLLVTSNKGCYDTISQQVIIYNLPTAHFGFTKACTNAPVQFTDSSLVTGSSIAAWSWDFGNGNTSITTSPTTVYQTALAYPIKLVVTSAYGCKDSLTRLLAVNQSPAFQISAADNCLGTPTAFHYTPQPGSSTNIRYNWVFGDSTAATQSNPSHVFANAGNYSYELTVTDISNGCLTIHTDTVSVHPYPHAAFTTDSACIHQAMQFTNTSTISNGSIVSWNWNAGIYGSGTGQQFALTLSNPDSLPVKLVVTSQAGCRDSVTHYAEVYPLPIVGFTPNPFYGAPPMNVQFQNVSGSGTYAWDFGYNTGTSTLAQPSYTYADTGTFSALLIVTSSKGCVDSVRKTLIVRAPVVDLSMESVNFTRSGDWWQLASTLRNLGNIDIRSFTINAKLDGRSLINERFDTDTLTPGKGKLFNFKTRFQASTGEDPSYLCLEITDVNNGIDDRIDNNRKCITASQSFDLFELFPNPATDVVHLGLNIPEAGETQVRIFDCMGNMAIPETTAQLPEGYNTQELSVNTLSAGLYVLEITYNGTIIIRKFAVY